MRILTRLVQRLADALGLVVLRKSSFEVFVSKSQMARRFEILRCLAPGQYDSLFFDLMRCSKSQLDQDLAAASASGFKRGGYFVEFGATNGLDLSNSHLLEKELGWKGILAEPSIEWHQDLRSNRNATISDKAVWSAGGLSLEFLENAELSTLNEFRNSDQHSRKGKRYMVETVTLNELLEENGAPYFIDFLSVDTEGSEYEVLAAFDFAKHQFGFICVEHNFTPKREEIHKLLSNNGYKRVLDDVSEWDDWYVPEHAS